MAARVLQVFNRYLHPGGEEKSVDRIYEHLKRSHEVTRCFFDSREWTAPGAPGKLGQLQRMFYNSESRANFDKALTDSRANVGLFHNLYPVASPSLYKAARDRRLPVVQYLHNFRPFSVSGTLYANGRMMPEALRGHYWREVTSASWQGSVLKSAMFAILLKLLHRSGWLQSVHTWVAISDFMREQLVKAGVSPESIVALRHSWDAMAVMPERSDDGGYLFLGRLVEVKGLLPLLDAWRMLRQRMGSNTPMLTIAGEGPLEAAVKQAAGENPSVRYAGMLVGEAKARALASCRALIVPSTWWEPLGLVVYEAYDHGKPVLAARSGGLTETVFDGYTGLLHEAGSVNGLIDSVTALEAMTSDQRMTWGENGRRWLLQDASVDAWTQRMNEILERAVMRH